MHLANGQKLNRIFAGSTAKAEETQTLIQALGSTSFLKHWASHAEHAV
jgi:hypothetical protein